MESLGLKSNFPKIYAFTATTTPKLLLRKNPKRKAVLIFNNGSVTVELVSPGGAYGQGIPILSVDATTKTAVGNPYKNDHFNPQGEYFVVAASGTCDLRVEEDIQEEKE